MDQLKLPHDVGALEEWLDESGGRTGRIVGPRRARWEDWSVVHALATGPGAPFAGGLTHLRRVGDGQFELRDAPDAAAEGALYAAMMFFDEGQGVDDVVDAVFGAAEYALFWRGAIGLRRWLVVDLALEDVDIDPDDCRAALGVDPRLPELGWYEYVAVLCSGEPPILIDFGVIRSIARLA